MSFKTDLQSNNTDLQAILDTINALPEAGSSGGGSVETCTVTITSSTYIEYLCATVATTEGISGCLYNSGGIGDVVTYTIENVLCNSYIGILSRVALPVFNISGGATVVEFASGFITFKAPPEAGANSTITIYDNF